MNYKPFPGMIDGKTSVGILRPFTTFSPESYLGLHFVFTIAVMKSVQPGSTAARQYCSQAVLQPVM